MSTSAVTHLSIKILLRSQAIELPLMIWWEGQTQRPVSLHGWLGPRGSCSSSLLLWCFIPIHHQIWARACRNRRTPSGKVGRYFPFIDIYCGLNDNELFLIIMNSQSWAITTPFILCSAISYHVPSCQHYCSPETKGIWNQLWSAHSTPQSYLILHFPFIYSKSYDRRVGY